MASFDLPILGPTEFESTAGGYWQVQIDFPSGPVSVDFNAPGAVMTAALLNRVQGFLAEIGRFDDSARAAILADFETGDDSPSQLYLYHHADEFSAEERTECFGTDAVESLGIKQLLAALRLRRVGLYPEEPDRVAIFDYTLGEDLTDYLLVIEFDARGGVINVTMES